MNNASLELGGTNWAEKDASLLGYTVSDDSGRFFPQEFTFSRGSNLAATRIGKTGLIEKGRENLLTHSNNFSNSDWTNSNITLTSGQEDPFGGSNGWRYLMSGGIGNSYLYQNNKTINGSVMVLSFWVKSNTGSNQTFRATANSGTQSSPDFTATTSWQRFSWFFISNAGNSNILLAYNPSTSSDLLIYGAQFEQGLAASPYIPTTTTTAQAGVLENTPRLNYTTGVADPYLLLEPIRTNQVSNSEYYGSYALQSASISQNETTSPEGLQNAAELIEDSSNDNHFLRIPNLSFTSGTDVVFSIYLKENTRRYARLRFDNTGGNTRAWLDLRTGETTFIDNTDSGVCASANVGNGWFRYEFKVTPTNTGTGSVQVFTQSVESVTGSLQTVYQGDGTSGIYVWGAQVETGGYPTSYIPTYSVSATRAKDVCIKTDASDLIGQEQGTIVFDFKRTFKNDSYTRYLAVDDNDSSKYRTGIFILPEPANDGRLYIALRNNSTSVFEHTYNDTTNERLKIAVAYSSGDIDFFVNGVKVNSSTTTFSFSHTLQRVMMDGSNQENNQILVFKTKLTDAELATLTTI